MASLIDANHYMLNTDEFRILEVFHSQSKVREYRDWVVQHMGLSKLPFKGNGQRVGVVDSVPDYMPLLCRDDSDDTLHVLTIAELYALAGGPETHTDQGEYIKTITGWSVWNGHAQPAKGDRWTPIVHVLRHEFEGELVRVWLRGGVVDVTKNHSLIDGRGGIIDASCVEAGRCLSLASTRNNTPVGREGRHFIGGKELAWFLGFFAAEGAVHSINATTRNGYVISVSQNKREPLERCQRILQDQLGVYSRIDGPCDGMYKLVATNNGLWHYLRDAATYNGMKRVPNAIINAPDDIKLEFLRGYNQGDGYTSNSTSRRRLKYEFYCFTTKSSLLAAGLTLLVDQVLDQAWAVQSRTDKPNIISIVMGKPGSDRVLKDRRRVQRIMPIRHTGYVYDIETACHTFGCGVGPVRVHNTGCDSNHQDLKGQVTVANFISGCKQIPAYQDNNGHGSFCCGEIVAKEDGNGIVGAAPQATCFSARVLYGDSRDMRRNSVNKDLGKAIRACVTEGCHVISMSLGGPGADAYTKDALTYAVSKGLIPVAAAGNERLEGSPYASYPASYPNVISVAAANKVDMPAWFSTVGAGGTQDCQPEVAVASLEFYYGCLPGISTYGTMIGTSQATPMIAALALLWREARELLAKTGGLPMPVGEDVFKQFRLWLRAVADDTNRNGWDAELGFGVAIIDPTEMP